MSSDEKKEKLLLTDLKKKESKLRADLKVQQRKAAELNNRIQRIIAEEIRKAEAKKAAEAKRLAEAERKANASSKSDSKSTSKSTSGKEKSSSSESSTSTASRPSGNVNALTREEQLLNGNFEANRGRLPWPTSNGFISGHYGIQAHPVLKHVTTNNKGVYIQTPVGSNARAVFQGKVTQIFYIQGNNGVIVQHGNYRTVYANLSQIFVREGQEVSAKQSIGKIYTDPGNDNKTELYFHLLCALFAVSGLCFLAQTLFVHNHAIS